MFDRGNLLMDLLSMAAFGGVFYLGTKSGYNTANREIEQRNQQSEINQLRLQIAELKRQKEPIS